MLDSPKRNVLVTAAGVALSGWMILVLDAPLWLGAIAAFGIGIVASGLLLTQLLLGSSDAPPTALEWILYPVALGVSAQTILLLALSYLPGALDPLAIKLALGLLSLLLAALVLVQKGRVAGEGSVLPDRALSRRQMGLLAGALVVIGLIGAFVRLGNIGYAEFHGDEARAVLRAAAVIQGYEDVLFVHRKPPGEILVPVAIFGFAGRIDEAAARLPFALASLAALVGVVLTGWRVRSLPVGLAAALLLAVDGYLVAFARFVQYQSVVVLLSVAATAIFLRLYLEPRALGRYMVAGAAILASALLFHWDGLLAFLPAAVLIAAMGIERRVSWGNLWRAALPAALVGAAVLLLFFVPYVLQPSATATAGYLVEARLAGATPGLRNNISDIVGRTAVYTSIWYVVALALLGSAALVQGLRRAWGRWAAVSGALLLAGAAAVGVLDLPLSSAATTAILALCLTVPIAGLWIAPRLSTPERMLWIWFGVPLLASLFAIATPRTHVHIFFVPWALVAGLAAADLLMQLERRVGQRPARLVAGVAATILIVVVGGWLLIAFVDGERELVARGAEDRPPLYWLPREPPAVDAKYGFPLNNGWKSVGAQYAAGAMTGDYGAVLWADFTPAWYLRGATRCESTAEWMMTPRALEPWAERPEDTWDRIQAQGFSPWADTTIDGRPSMRVFAREDDDTPLSRPLELAEDGPTFNLLADPYLPLAFPSVATTPSLRLDANFGDLIALEGVDLHADSPLLPGDEITLTLFWRALGDVGESYKVTNQIYNEQGEFAGQKDSIPMCDRSDTLRWRDGEGIVDRHTIVINPEAQAGSYSLYTALYHSVTGERLAVLGGDGIPVDDKVMIATVEIVAP